MNHANEEPQLTIDSTLDTAPELAHPSAQDARMCPARTSSGLTVEPPAVFDVRCASAPVPVIAVPSICSPRRYQIVGHEQEPELNTVQAQNSYLEYFDIPFRFGVEIEVKNLSLRQMHLRVAACLGVEPLPPPRKAWDVKSDHIFDRDGRLWEIKDEDDNITELATPILTCHHDLRTLCAVADGLHTTSASTLGACGIHVHVDASSLMPGQIINLAALMVRHQNALEELLEIRPERIGFCQRLSDQNVQDLLAVRNLPREEFCDEIISTIRGRDRNLNLRNLCNEHKHTVEFRLFNSSLDPIEIERYVRMALGMVKASFEEPFFAVSGAPITSATLQQHHAQMGSYTRIPAQRPHGLEGSKAA